MYRVLTHKYRYKNRIPDEPADCSIFVNENRAKEYYAKEVDYQKSVTKDSFWSVELVQDFDDESLCLAIESNDK